MKHLALITLLAAACGCSATSQQPVSLNSPRLDSGIRGNGGGGLGGEGVVGRPTGAGIVNQVTVPR